DDWAIRAEAESAGAAVVPGGETRALSSLNGILAAERADTVVVHDAARPFATGALLSRVLNAAVQAVAAVPVV
ncbi:MAG: bifunctional enzyme IspD/IspF, partial [Armatimonadota bacterium]